MAKLLAKGAVRRDIMEYCLREWDIRDTQAKIVLRDARELLIKDWELDRREFLAELMSQYADVAKIGRRTNNLSVTLGALNQMARLAKLVS